MNDCRSEEEFGLYICWSQSISPLQCRSELLIEPLTTQDPSKLVPGCFWQTRRLHAPSLCNTDVQSDVDLVLS
jgi:hypothetical protein